MTSGDFTDTQEDSINIDNEEGQEEEDYDAEMEDEDYEDGESSTTSKKTRDSHYAEGSVTDKALELLRDHKEEDKLKQQTMEGSRIIKSTNFQ